MAAYDKVINKVNVRWIKYIKIYSYSDFNNQIHVITFICIIVKQITIKPKD